MTHIGRRTLVFILILIVTILILFSYMFTNSRADRITSNEEYIKSLKEASRGKQLAGQQPFPTVSSIPEPIEQKRSSNLIEEIIAQIKELFRVR